jgi:hypothetical protein
MAFFKKDEKINVDLELAGVISFLKEVGDDLRIIYKQCVKMQELRSHRKDLHQQQVPSIGKDFNLAEQIKVWDKLLKYYEFFDDDVEISKTRVQMIGNSLKKQMINTKIPEELQNKVKTANWWNFRW